MNVRRHRLMEVAHSLEEISAHSCRKKDVRHRHLFRGFQGQDGAAKLSITVEVKSDAGISAETIEKQIERGWSSSTRRHVGAVVTGHHHLHAGVGRRITRTESDPDR